MIADALEDLAVADSFFPSSKDPGYLGLLWIPTDFYGLLYFFTPFFDLKKF